MNRFSRRALLATVLASGAAHALGRRPLTGNLKLGMLWSTATLDPHAASDIAATAIGSALFDSLFARAPGGQPYPTLAARGAEQRGSSVVVTLRRGLVTGKGKALDAKDVMYSLERARRYAAAGLLRGWKLRTTSTHAMEVHIAGASAEDVSRALASPVTALVPRGFSASDPDGTGAFIATRRGNALSLDRNPNAARGGSYLNSVRLQDVDSIDEQLRGFEARELDVAWLGAGLHGKRADSRLFDLGALGWLVLHSGEQAGKWGAAGVAQRLLDGLDSGVLATLGVKKPQVGSRVTWGGPSSDLYFASDSAHLGATAEALAAALSAPSHVLTPRSVPASEIAQLVQSRRFPLALDFTRFVAPDHSANLAALVASSNPRIIPHSHALQNQSASAVCRSLPMGVVGELHLSGAIAERWHAPPQLRLEEVWAEEPAALGQR